MPAICFKLDPTPPCTQTQLSPPQLLTSQKTPTPPQMRCKSLFKTQSVTLHRLILVINSSSNNNDDQY